LYVFFFLLINLSVFFWSAVNGAFYAFRGDVYSIPDISIWWLRLHSNMCHK